MVKFKKILCAALVFLALSAPSFADELQDYKSAVTKAQVMALQPDTWKFNNLTIINPGGKALVRTLTKYLPSAAAGRDSVVYGTDDATWVTTGTEMRDYWKKEKIKTVNVRDETLKVLGMPTPAINPRNAANNFIFEFEVQADVNHIQRPAKSPAISLQPTHLGKEATFSIPTEMDPDISAKFQKYYNKWLHDAFNNSIHEANYPWTQLGYTYRWGKGDSKDQIRGLSEFIVLSGTAIRVVGVYTLQSFMYNDGGGNGNFTITGDHGPVDSILAGRKFQERGDYINISKNGAVKDGNGIRIFSPGYYITNDGVIAVSADENIENIAVLFSDDAAFGSSGSVNKLVNTGTINSPNIAVRSLHYDTQITFKGGEVWGAFELGTGNDSLNIEGATTFHLPIWADTPGILAVASNDIRPPVKGVENVYISAPIKIWLDAKNVSPEKLVGKKIKIFDERAGITGFNKSNVTFMNYEVSFDEYGNIEPTRYNPSSPSGGGGGGSGCNAGLSALLLIPLLFILKRKF